MSLTFEDLDALPVGSTVKDFEDETYRKTDSGMWLSPGPGGRVTGNQLSHWQATLVARGPERANAWRRSVGLLPPIRIENMTEVVGDLLQ